MNRVVIFQHRLLHYRVGLFEMLRDRCRENSIELHLVHGQATARDKVRNDVEFLSWAHSVKSPNFFIYDQDLLWLPFPAELRDADLVVLMQENRQLSNYSILLSRIWSNRKVAYWGHGVNFQSDAPSGLKERWKNFLLTKVDWWFAYTQMTADIVAQSGYPVNQITCLNNAIDTESFKKQLASISEEDLRLSREAFRISPDAPVGIFCGSLYTDKRLDFLIAAADLIHEQSPNFHCIILGDGPSMPLMQEASTTRPWLHLLGVTKDEKKALYFRMADFMLNPGLVGLHIVDAFCAGLVMVTTSGARHSPEVVYLKHGVNGLMTSDSIDEYTKSVMALIHDNDKLKKLKKAALKDAEKYTVDNMATQFLDGIKKCLAR